MKNTAILGIGNVCSKCLIFVMIPFFSRWLSTERYGLFDLYYTYMSLLTPLLLLACNEAVFRYLLDTESADEKSAVISNGLVLLLLGLLVGVIGSVIFFVAGRREFVLPFLSLLVFTITFTFMTDCLRGLKELKHYAVANAIFVVVMAAFSTIFILLCGMGLAGILYGYAAGYLAGTIYASIKARLPALFRIKKIRPGEIRNLLKYSIPLVPNSVSWWIVMVSDRTLVSVILGSAYNGIYSMANKVPNLCMTLFGVFHLSWQADASEVINEEDAGAYFDAMFSKLICGLVSICVCVLSINFLIFDYLLDSAYADGYFYVGILITSVIFSFISQYIGGIFIALKKPGVNGSTTIIAAIVNLALNIIFIRSFGLYAASFATLASYMVLFTIRYIYIGKRFKLHFGRRVYLFTAIYLYFVVCQYINLNTLNLVNIIIAGALFVYTNRNMCLRLIKAIRLKMNRKLSDATTV